MDYYRSRSRAGNDVICQSIALVATLNAVLLSKETFRVDRINTEAFSSGDIEERLRVAGECVRTPV
jgi:hypothetical protein